MSTLRTPFPTVVVISLLVTVSAFVGLRLLVPSESIPVTPEALPDASVRIIPGSIRTHLRESVYVPEGNTVILVSTEEGFVQPWWACLFEGGTVYALHGNPLTLSFTWLPTEKALQKFLGQEDVSLAYKDEMVRQWLAQWLQLGLLRFDMEAADAWNEILSGPYHDHISQATEFIQASGLDTPEFWNDIWELSTNVDNEGGTGTSAQTRLVEQIRAMQKEAAAGLLAACALHYDIETEE